MAAFKLHNMCLKNNVPCDGEQAHEQPDAAVCAIQEDHPAAVRIRAQLFERFA